ncbi:MAG: hypothetical protein ACK5R5_03600 [Alphaproteobacteria bacterium]
MGLRAGGGPLLLRRELGLPGPVQGQLAFGAPLYGARLAAPLLGTVRMRAGDGAFQLQIPVAGGSITLVAQAGVFALAGQDAALRVDRRVVADAGAFALAGQDAALRLDRRLVADAGAFALIGQDAALRRDIRQVVEAGAFTLAGQEALLSMARRLVAEAGAFALAGQDIEFVVPISGGLVVARLARRPAQIARPAHRPAVIGLPSDAPRVVVRLIIRGDDNL